MTEYSNRGLEPGLSLSKSRVRYTILRITAVLIEILCEIFDEAAYSRFLSRMRTERSRESYADFLRENEQAKARRPRCC